MLTSILRLHNKQCLFVFYLDWAKTYVDAKSYYDHTNSAKSYYDHTNSAICVFTCIEQKPYVDVSLTTSSQMMIISTAFLNLKRHVHWEAKNLPSRMRMIISTTFLLPWLFLPWVKQPIKYNAKQLASFFLYVSKTKRAPRVVSSMTNNCCDCVIIQFPFVCLIFAFLFPQYYCSQHFFAQAEMGC